MKLYKPLAVVAILIILLAMTAPAFAQLGDTDVSSITIQNISDTQTQVTVQFVDEAGVTRQPNQLDNKTPTQFPNPFMLDPGNARQIYVPNIPSDQLPPGRYAVVISSQFPVVAVAGLSGSGTRQFNGSYSGFSSGATTSYLATTAFNFFGWYGMISVQNLGDQPANVTLTITCSSGAVGTLTQLGIPKFSEHTFVLKNTTPSGFTASTSCIGSSMVTSTNGQPIVIVNNQNVPASGQTNTFEGAPIGYSKLFVPNLSSNFSGWSSSLNIRKLGSGSTTVTVDYSDAEPNDTCNLTDATPSCQLYMPTFHPTAGRFGATITASPSMQLLAVVGTTKGSLSGAYVGVGTGTNTVAIPMVSKYYFNWISAINCQNVSTTPTTVKIAYQGFAPYDYPTTLNEGDSFQRLVTDESFLPNGFIGGVTITANNTSAQIACTVGTSNPANALVTPGDWNNQYNAFNK